MKNKVEITISLQDAIGYSTTVMKKISGLVKKKAVEICKQKKWKISNCNVTSFPKITIVVEENLPVDQQTADWTELLSDGEK